MGRYIHVNYIIMTLLGDRGKLDGAWWSLASAKGNKKNSNHMKLRKVILSRPARGQRRVVMLDHSVGNCSGVFITTKPFFLRILRVWRCSVSGSPKNEHWSGTQNRRPLERIVYWMDCALSASCSEHPTELCRVDVLSCSLFFPILL